MLKSNLKQLHPVGVRPVSVADPQVPATPRRRHFTAGYERSILDHAEACRDEGAMDALLRRERLYSSHLTPWRASMRSKPIALLLADLGVATHGRRILAASGGGKRRRSNSNLCGQVS